MATKTKHPQDKVIAQVTMATPLGPVYLAFSAKGLTSLTFAGKGVISQNASEELTPETPSLLEETLQKWRTQVAQALEKYFAEKPVSFEDLPLDLEGSPFHLRVWRELRKIPPGETVSYQELARRLGNPKAARAVGQACGANPIPLIVPCHRVIAANGTLGGFSSGLEHKRWLLRHEKEVVGGGPGTWGPCPPPTPPSQPAYGPGKAELQAPTSPGRYFTLKGLGEGVWGRG